MANVEINDLASKATPIGTDEIEIQETAGGTSKKTTIAKLFDTDNHTDGSTNHVFTAAEDTKLAGIEALADVTDTTNVTSAGALMDSEVDADLKTFSLPANTTISAFGATLVDDAAASNARTTLGVVIGTDVLAQQTIGIADDNLLEVDDADAADNDFAKFTANGLEGRSYAEVRTDINVEDGADVTDTTNVTAAGALMDSEVDADLKTFALPANTTISAFGATVVDDANAAAVIATLSLDADLATFALPASTTISAFGATLVDDADAVAARTTLGLDTPLNTQTGTTYAIVLTDAGKMITMNNAAANTATLPANASIAFPVGSEVSFMQLGAGATTIAITTDTLSVESSLTLVLAGQYAVASAKKVTTTQWVLFGNLTAS